MAFLFMSSLLQALTVKALPLLLSIVFINNQILKLALLPRHTLLNITSDLALMVKWRVMKASAKPLIQLKRFEVKPL